MAIEVVYSSEVEHIDLVFVDFVEGMSVESAVQSSGFLEKYPEINAESHRLSIYGQRVKAERPVKAGDRIEILRPLTVDPMTARRLRANKAATNRRRS